jgi:hypothetical protein
LVPIEDVQYGDYAKAWFGRMLIAPREDLNLPPKSEWDTKSRPSHLLIHRAYLTAPLTASAAPQSYDSAALPSAAQAPDMVSGAELANGVTVTGSVVFRGLSDLKEREVETDRITQVLTRYGAHDLRWADPNTVTFSGLGTDVIPRLIEDLKYKPDRGTAGGKVLMHELLAFGCRLEATYRTADIRAGIETTLSFKVTPGAKLYYSPAPGQPEQEVAVGSDGTVGFRIKIARGQDAIYARTQLGAVNRYIRVDVFSGEVTDATETEYRTKTSK